MHCSVGHSLQAGCHAKLFLHYFSQPCFAQSCGFFAGALCLSLAVLQPAARPDFALPFTSSLATGLQADFLSKLLFPLISSWHPSLGFCLPLPPVTAPCLSAPTRSPGPGKQLH